MASAPTPPPPKSSMPLVQPPPWGAIGDRAAIPALETCLGLHDDELLRMVINLGTHDEDREKVVKAAMAAVESETRKLDSEAEVIRHRLTTVQTEIANLLGVLKRLGAGAVASVQDELAKLEGERSQLQDRLRVHVEQSAPKAAGAAEAAQQFVRAGISVGELLEQATPDERRVILQHYVEVVAITFDDPGGRIGKYTPVCFPRSGLWIFHPLELETEPPKEVPC
jgi:hypothetical protein